MRSADRQVRVVNFFIRIDASQVKHHPIARVNAAPDYSRSGVRKPVRLPSQTGFLGRGGKHLTLNALESLDFALEVLAWDKLYGF